MSYTNGSVSPYPPTSEPGVPEAPEALESDVEDEVDELDSESDTAETETDTQTGSTIAQCPPGETLLPQVRLENILSADGVTGNLALSKEGLFILSVATEEFIKKMAQAGHLRANTERRTSVNYSDMCATTQQYQEFMFLDETIPVPIPLSEAISLRATKEKESFDDDPTAPPSGHPSTSISVSAPKKAKSRTNGTAPKKATNDTAYSDWTDARPSRPGGKPALSIYNGRLSLSARPSPLANGHSASTAPTRSGTQTPSQPHAPNEHPSPQHQPSSMVAPTPAQAEENQSTPPQPQFSGPASGFLQPQEGPAPFGRVTQNPGRTIYSQEFRAE